MDNILDEKEPDAIESKRTRRRKKIVFVLAVVGLFTVDRYLFMDDRVVDNNWSFERGHYIADPIHFGQHCELRGNKIFFYKTNEQVWVAGCYMGQLFLYDFDSEVLTRYSKL